MCVIMFIYFLLFKWCLWLVVEGFVVGVLECGIYLLVGVVMFLLKVVNKVIREIKNYYFLYGKRKEV